MFVLRTQCVTYIIYYHKLLLFARLIMISTWYVYSRSRLDWRVLMAKVPSAVKRNIRVLLLLMAKLAKPKQFFITEC